MYIVIINDRPLVQNPLQQQVLVLHPVVLQVQAVNLARLIQRILVVLLIVKKHPMWKEQRRRQLSLLIDMENLKLIQLLLHP